MYTLGTESKTICKLEESWALNIGAVADAVMARGQMVKLNADGTVSPIDAVTTKPFGMVTAGNNAANTPVTIQTEFSAVVRMAADGAVTCGNKLSFSGVQTTGEKLTKAKVSVSTNVVSAIALSSGADTESIMVGILRTSAIL